MFRNQAAAVKTAIIYACACFFMLLVCRCFGCIPMDGIQSIYKPEA